jgi:hypothetical protein
MPHWWPAASTQPRGRRLARLTVVHHRIRRRWIALLAVVVVSGLASPQTGCAQATPPGGTTPGGKIFDRLREQTTRPLPQTPPLPRAPGSDMIWVPERSVRVPGVDGNVMVPPHWEQRVSEHEVYVPPLTGQTSDGRVIQFPAGPRPVPHERQSP